jgi:aminocarboxymuconate-semialdehyde decarboxylase
MQPIVEWHTHVIPPEDTQDPHWRGKCPLTIENVLDAHDKNDIALSVVTDSIHQLKDYTKTQALDALKGWHDRAAGLQEQHRGKIVCFASTVPTGGRDFECELTRAFDQLNLKGVFITSSMWKTYPDDDEALPFWEIVADRDLPVFIHPPASAYGEERMRNYGLNSSIGRPADSMLCLARLIVRGIYERFPNLKIVASHLGGGISEVIGRMDYAYEMREDSFLGSYAPLLIKAPPSHYLKKMYLDLACYHLPAAKCAMETVGVDHVLYGSDAPPLTWLKPRAIQLVNDLPVSEDERAKIFAGNALKLMKLKAADLPPALQSYAA